MINEILSHHLFAKILLLLVLSRLLGELFERMNKPSMLGEILAGIILGSSILGWINIDAQLKVISDLAVFFLVILAGLEIDANELKNAVKGKNIWISIMGFVVPILLGILTGAIFSLSLTASIFLGLCISITALPVSIRLLMDIGKLHTDIGKKIISTAALNDILSLMLLGILTNSTSQPSISLVDIGLLLIKTIFKVTFFFATIIIAYRLINRIIKHYQIQVIENFIDHYLSFLKSKESVFSFVLLFILVFASISEMTGLHMVVGTFFGALLLRKEILGKKHYHAFEKNINSMSAGFLSPLFFAIIGLVMNIKEINDFLLLLFILFISAFAKIIGGLIGGRIARHSLKESLVLGIGINGRGLMDIVIATIAYENHLIDANLYSILIINSMVATFSTSFILKSVFQWLDKGR